LERERRRRNTCRENKLWQKHWRRPRPLSVSSQRNEPKNCETIVLNEKLCCEVITFKFLIFDASDYIDPEMMFSLENS
jgi:hypothetical protein